jgi:cyclopropane fatty-acyl-phospholipid synthase-like methyltransferase
MKYTEAEAYWDKAGDVSYAAAMFSDSEVERHVNRRLWQVGVDIGRQLGLTEQSHVLDLGCGDGALSNLLLSKHYQAVDGYDLSIPAIKRANSLAAHEKMRFEACDITTMDYAKLPQYDGAYLWGILHHVKDATPHILRNLRKCTKNIVILEPNGNNLMRKFLELTPTYKAAGEDSFRTSQMEQIFKDAGYYPVVWKRLNLFPNFTPKFLFKMLKNIEPVVEATPILRSLCTVNMWGFKAYE